MADQQEIQLVLEAIARGLGDISRLAGELDRTGDSADETEDRLGRFDAAVEDLKGRITNLKDTLGDLAGAFLSIETVQYITDQIKAAAATKAFAESIGLSTETLSGYQAVLGKFGVEAEDTNDALGSLTEKVYEAAEAGSDASELFSALGVSVTDSAGAIKSTDQILAELADGMKNSQDATANTAVALGLFGDVGLKLLPVLTQGADGMQELTDAAKENGEVLTNEQAAAAQQAASALSQMGADLAAAGREMAITFAPAVEYGAALTRDLIDVVDFLGKSIGNLAFTITNLDFSGYQERQKELFNELTAGIAANHAEIGKAAEALEDAGKKAETSAKQTEEFGWNLTIAGRAATDLSGTIDEILGKPIDATAATQLGLALEVAGQKAGNTSEIIENQLNASIANLSNDQLQKLQQASQQAFESGRLGAESYEKILKSISTGALTQLGVDTEKLSSGFTGAEKDAFDLFKTVTDSAQSSAEAIQSGLLQTLQSIESPAGLAELQARFDALKESGKLTETQLAELSPIFDQIAVAVQNGIEPGEAFDALLGRLKDSAAATAEGISGLEQAFKTLGLEAPGVLQGTADAAAQAYAVIAAGTEDLTTQREAWLVYADAALKAADAAGQPAPKLLEQQAATLGLTASYGELQRAVAAASPEFDALAVAMDRQTEIVTARLATLQQEIDLQSGVAEAVTAATIARGDEVAAADAAVAASQARVAAAIQEADALTAAARATEAKLAALEAEKEAAGGLSAEQDRILVLLREEVTQKAASSEAARARAAAVQTEEEATGRLTAALDAGLAAVKSQYQPQLDLAEAKIAAAKATLDAAEASGNEAAAAEALIGLKETEAEAARLSAELKLAEAEAAREAADAVQSQALADGKLTAAEIEAAEAAQAGVAAKEAAADAALTLADAAEQAAEATRQQGQAATGAAQATAEWKGDMQGVSLAFAQIGDLAAAAFDTRGIRIYQAAIEEIDRKLAQVSPLLSKIRDALDGASTAAGTLSLERLLSEARTLAGSLDTVRGYMQDTARAASEDLLAAIAAARQEMEAFAESQREALTERLREIEDFRAQNDEFQQEELRHRREIIALEEQLALARSQGNSVAVDYIMQQIDAENELHTLKMRDLKEQKQAQEEVNRAATDTRAVTVLQQNVQSLADLSKNLKPANDELRTMLQLLVQIELQSGKTSAAMKKYIDEMLRQLQNDSLAR